jgi:hypothetical protein
MGPLCINDPQYEVMTKKYGVPVHFCPKLVIFGKTAGTPMDFERKFDFFFKNRKKSYT